jgi:hypothetical protein
VSFAATILYVASQRVFIIVVYFVIDSVWKLLNTPSYVHFQFIVEDVGVDRRITLR